MKKVCVVILIAFALSGCKKKETPQPYISSEPYVSVVQDDDLDKLYDDSDRYSHAYGLFDGYDNGVCRFDVEDDTLNLSCDSELAENLNDYGEITYYRDERGAMVLEEFYNIPEEPDEPVTRLLVFVSGDPETDLPAFLCRFYLLENYETFHYETLDLVCREDHYQQFIENPFNIFEVDYMEGDGTIVFTDMRGTLPNMLVSLDKEEDGLCRFERYGGEHVNPMHCQGISGFPKDDEFLIYYIDNVIDDYPVLMGFEYGESVITRN